MTHSLGVVASHGGAGWMRASTPLLVAYGNVRRTRAFRPKRLTFRSICARRSGGPFGPPMSDDGMQVTQTRSGTSTGCSARMVVVPSEQRQVSCSVHRRAARPIHCRQLGRMPRRTVPRVAGSGGRTARSVPWLSADGRPLGAECGRSWVEEVIHYEETPRPFVLQGACQRREWPNWTVTRSAEPVGGLVEIIGAVLGGSSTAWRAAPPTWSVPGRSGPWRIAQWH